MSAYNRAQQLRIDNQSEPQPVEGGIWNDMSDVETALKDSDFFADECAEIMADFLTSYRDSYAEAKFMRLMRVLADRCESHINALDGEL